MKLGVWKEEDIYDMMVLRMEKKIDVLCDVRLRVMLDIVSET